MAERFVDIDRDTPLLLPPDLRESVARGRLVHFVLEAANGVDMSAFKINHHGSGSEQYPPRMMFALLVLILLS